MKDFVKLCSAYGQYHTSTTVEKFLAYQHNYTLSFLDTPKDGKRPEVFFFICVTDQITNSIIFTMQAISGNRPNLFEDIMRMEFKSGLHSFLEPRQDRKNLLIDLFVVPVKDKKSAAVIKKHLCPFESETKKFTDTNPIRHFIDEVKNKLSIGNVLSLFIAMFSIVVVSIVVRLLIFGFPLHSISIESVVLIAEETLLFIGGLILAYTLVMGGGGVLPLHVLEKMSKQYIIKCKPSLLDSIKSALVTITAGAMIFLAITLMISGVNFVRATYLKVDDPLFKDYLVDMAVESYTMESTLPAIQEVQFSDQNQSQIILMMGIRDNIVYYYPKEVVQEIVQDKNSSSLKKICDGNATYPTYVNMLLRSTKLRHKKNEKASLRDIHLISEYHSFHEAFCKDK
ncbi:hypothetical protein ACM66T_01075 [Sulfurimonas sp. ST-25]